MKQWLYIVGVRDKVSPRAFRVQTVHKNIPVQDLRLSKWFGRSVGTIGIRYRVDWQGSTKASYTLPAPRESRKTSSTELRQAPKSTATLVPSYQPTHHHIPGSSYLHFIPCSIIPLIRSLFLVSVRINMSSACRKEHAALPCIQYQRTSIIAWMHGNNGK